MGRVAALLVVALALLRGAALAVLVPPYQAPDEPAHFDYVQHLAESGRMADGGEDCAQLSAEGMALLSVMQPLFADRGRPVPPAGEFLPPAPTPEARSTRLCSSAARYPPVYYLTAAAAYRAARGAPFLHRLLAARLVSVAWGALGAGAAFLLGLWLLGGWRGGLLTGLAYALQPMQALMFSSVNNDAALFSLSTVGFAAAAALRAVPGARAPLAALAAAALLGSLSKPTFLLLTPALLVAVAAALGPARPASWIRGALALLPAAAGLAWTLSRNPGGASSHPSAAGPGLVDFASRLALSPARLEELWLRQYWASWGWHETRLPIHYYRVVEILVGLALVGAVLGWRHLSSAERGLVAVSAAATVAALVPIHVFEYGFHRSSGGLLLQGRYLLPMFALHAAALATALRGLGRRLRAPGDGGFALPALLGVLLAAISLHALVRYYA